MARAVDDITGIAFASVRFIEVAKDGIALLEHSAREASEAAAELKSREGERQSASTVEAIVEATKNAHVARWNADSRLEFMGILDDLVSDSIQVACGALLQLAKQTVAAKHGAPQLWPRGRVIGQQPIRDVIWQARNQSAHADEGDYKPEVLRVFGLLEADFGSHFHVQVGLCVSRAREVVELLGWLQPKQFGADVQALLRSPS